MQSRFTLAVPVESHAWLLERYWVHGWLVLVLALPLALLAGSMADVIGLSVYALITATAWGGLRRWHPLHAIRFHLAAVMPYWAWYSMVPGGLPARLDSGVSAYVTLFFFPILATVALDGWRGAGLALGLSGALIANRFGTTIEALAGWFLCTTAVLVGVIFRHQSNLLKDANERLRCLAAHDPETDLPNRRALEEVVARLDATPAALFLIDLCRFKTVEDGYGRAVALELLRAVSRRLLEEGSEHSLLAHLGGDRFALLVAELEAEPARALAERLVRALETPFSIDQRSIQVASRAGVALWPYDGNGSQSLVRRAERAADLGRQQGSQVTLYDAALDPERERELEMELMRAIQQKELFPYFQPVFELRQQTLVGVEALVRWRHPQRGLVGPAAFVEAAEESGLIVHLDRMMLEQVVLQLEEWQRGGLDLWVAANVSARTLDDPTFLETMRILAQDHPTARGRLMLEITESAAMRDPARTAELLGALRILGFSAALDDFGIGYSSLAYLKQLPASHLKLDRAFVSGIGRSAGDIALLDLLLQLAKLFDLQIVAEGIEREDQLLWLKERGCELAQGFLLARPMPAADVTQLARASKRPAPRPSMEASLAQG